MFLANKKAMIILIEKSALLNKPNIGIKYLAT
jgi:hypothetical protein